MATIEGWFRPSQILTRAWIRSEPHLVPFHYVAGIGSARCPGHSCELCPLITVELHALIVIQVGETRTVKLLDVKPHNAECIRALLELGPATVGLPVWTWVDVADHGMPIIVSLDKPADAPNSQTRQRIELKPIPCSRYIERIGIAQYRRALGTIGQIRLALPAA